MLSIPFLQKGDKVAIISPASPPKTDQWIEGLAMLEQWGLEIIVSPHHLAKHFGLAGTDQQRLHDLQWALNEASIKAIFPIRGGYGSSRLIDQLDFSLFKQHPKWIVGFSDITALLMHLSSLGFPSIHGPMPHNFLQPGGEIALENLKRLLFNEQFQLEIPSNSSNKLGTAEGEIIGGNLSLIVHLIGTKSFPCLKGKILLLEEIGENLYHIDRMLVQLKRGGFLSELAGMIVGGFTDCKEASLEMGKSVNELILEHTSDYNYPIIFEFPAGHIPNNQPILFGVKSNLLVNSGKIQLTYQM